MLANKDLIILVHSKPILPYVAYIIDFTLWHINDMEADLPRSAVVMACLKSKKKEKITLISRVGYADVKIWTCDELVTEWHLAAVTSQWLPPQRQSI